MMNDFFMIHFSEFVKFFTNILFANYLTLSFIIRT